MRCVSRQEDGNIMMVPVISVACRQFKMKTRSFPVHLHANMFVEASTCRLVSQFINGTQNYCQSDWSFLLLPRRMPSKQTNDSYRFISELMDVFLIAGVQQQPEQSNYLAEGQTCKLDPL